MCSRGAEYEEAAKFAPLDLQNAVEVQPLSYEKVDAYLAKSGRPFEALRRALIENIALRELVNSPLMLSVLMLTYEGKPVHLEFREGAELQLVWTNYVRRMVEQKGNAKRYPLERTCMWLHWLAREMRERNQTIFFLERLQPDWLHNRGRFFYQLSVGLAYGLIFGLIFGLIGALVGLLIGGSTGN